MVRNEMQRGAASSMWTIGGLIVVIVAGGLFYLNQDFGKPTEVKANSGVKAAANPAAAVRAEAREAATAPDEEMASELTKYTDKNGVVHFVKRDPLTSQTPDGRKTQWQAEVKVSNFTLAPDKIKSPEKMMRNRSESMPRLQRDPTTGKYVTGKNRNKGTTTTPAPTPTTGGDNK
jgi:hypothetical protein